MRFILAATITCLTLVAGDNAFHNKRAKDQWQKNKNRIRRQTGEQLRNHNAEHDPESKKKDADSAEIPAEIAEISGDKNIIELLKMHPIKFSTLATLLENNNLIDTIAAETGGIFTLFAPTNYAFEKVSTKLDKLSPLQVVEVLRHHVVAGKALSSDLTDGQEIPSLRQGSDLTVTIREQTSFWHTSKEIYINDVLVIMEDWEASNGIIHVVEEVLLPDDLNHNTIADKLDEYVYFSKLKELLVTHGLIKTVKNTPDLTLIAPTNVAFKEIENILPRFTGDDGAQEVTKVLAYHLLPQIVKFDDLADGQSYDAVYLEDKVNVSVAEVGWRYWKRTIVKFEDSLVLKAKEIEGSNGVIHVVDSVMIPDSVTIPNTVVDVVVGMEKFSTLVNLLAKFNLADTLEGIGPFTLFAPTNDAFSDIKDILKHLTETQVTNLLLHHVASGKVLSKQLTDGKVVNTLYPGNMLTVSTELKGGWRCTWFGYGCSYDIKINESDVRQVDVDADNGVIHVLDKVIIPANL